MRKNPPLQNIHCILPYFWIPEDTLEFRVRRDHVPYDIWERQGYLETTEGNVVHYGYIEKFIEQFGERFNIREIAFDRWGVYCKIELPKVANGNWRMLHLQIGESCKAFARSAQERCSA